MYKKLSSPDIKVTFNDIQIESGFFWDYQGAEDEHINRCILTPYGEAAEALDGADITDVIVEIGCEDDYSTILEGHGYHMDETESILVKDETVQLKSTVVQGTFLNCYPQEVVRYILTQCGISQYQLSKKNYERKSIFTVPAMSALQAIQELQQYWNIDVFFGFHESTFYWDCEPEQNEIYELDENNILELEQNGNTWTAEIVAVPWIRIGQTILVTDSQFYGLARIKKCVIKSKSRGKVDMYIQFIGTK